MAIDRTPRGNLATALLLTLVMVTTSWVAFLQPAEPLEENPAPDYAIVSNAATKDAQINGSAPNNNYGSDGTMLLAKAGMFDTRSLISFNMTDQGGNPMPSSNRIHSATLRIKCTQMTFMGAGRTVYYAAPLLISNWSESSANWNRASTSVNWSSQGADALGLDRDHWEPPTTSSSSGWISLNVTRIAQQALRDNTSEVSLLLSGIGVPSSCITRDSSNTADRPELQVSYSTVGSTSLGSIQIDSPNDGSVVMEPAILALTPDLTPEIEWSLLNGSGVEIQFSADSSYRTLIDGDWHWTSWNDASAFSLNQNGSFLTPSTNLSVGTNVHMRVRSTLNDILGDWQESTFGLPNVSASLQFDSTYSFTLTNDSLGLGKRTVKDTFVTSGNTSFTGGSEYNLLIGNSNDTNVSDAHTMLTITWSDVGMHANASIIDAELALRRTDRDGEAIISVWTLDKAFDDQEANWTSNGLGLNWTDGGIDYIGESVGALNGNQSTPWMAYDLTYIIQERLRAGDHSDLHLMVRGYGGAGENITIGSSEEALEYLPKLTVNYDWGDGVSPSPGQDLTPRDGGGAWTQTEGNLTQTTTPTLTWNTTSANAANDVLIEISTDSTWNQSITLRADSRKDSGFDLTNGEFLVPSSWALDLGSRLWWRMQWIEEGDRSDWVTHSMLLTELNSTHLGNDEYSLSLRHGNASSIVVAPFCKDTYLDSGNTNGNENGNYISVSSTQVGLVSCDLDGHLLPEGTAPGSSALAVVSASLKLRTDPFASPSNVAVTVYENGRHEWKEDHATWNTYDGTNAWSGPGASGTDRVTSLDSTTVSSSGTWYEWNVTGAVQKAMRWGEPANFILTANGAVTFSDKEASSSGSPYWPTLEIVYTQGSDDAPATPIGLAPDNGLWMIDDDYRMQSILRPTLNWTTDASLANAVEVQLDTTSTLSSSSLLSYQSWIDTSAFSLATGEFSPTSDLSTSQIWYWRVRGLSQTGQVGNWSQIAWFRLPDVQSTLIDPDTAEIEMRHHGWLASESHPSFNDTWIDLGPSGLNDTHGGSGDLVVGRTSLTDGPKDALLAFPMSANLTLPRPTDCRIVGATLHLYVIGTNATQPTISTHAAIGGFNESANGTTRDGTNNWSSMSNGSDVGPPTDIVSVTTSGWQEFNITEIVQNTVLNDEDYAYVRLLSSSSEIAQATIASIEHTSSGSRPYLTVQVRNGTMSPSQIGVNATLISPMAGEVVWMENGHVLESDTTPSLTWSQPGWNSTWHARVLLWDDADDERAGWTIYDSRYDPGFEDLANQTFTPPTLSVNDRYRWFVQPIYGDILSHRTAPWHFDVPNDLSWAINSTDAHFEARRGSAVTSTETYDLMDGGSIDSFSPSSSYSQFYIGRSAGSLAAGHRTHTLLSVDVGQIPIPEPWEVLDATIELYKSSGAGSAMNPSMNISVMPVNRNWDEATVNWQRYAVNQTWQAAGGTGANDTGEMLDTTEVNNNGWYSWDVTAAMQQARVRGDDFLSLMFQTSDPSPSNLYVFHNEQYSSTIGDRALRPILNVTYRVGTQWVPDDVTSLNPNTETTMWDWNALRPQPRSPVSLDWNHTASNATWDLEVSTDPQFAESVLELDSTNSSQIGTFGSTNFTFASSTSWSDEWIHWRVRPIDGTRLGNWSTGGSFRVPTEIGSDDGAGNYSVTLKRGIVFVDSGLLPGFPDTYVDSATPFGVTQNHGSDGQIAVGNSPDTSGADAVSLLDLDLGELPFPSTILPTGVTLRLYRGTYSGTGAHSVEIQECFSNTWTESSVTWSTYDPTTQCSASGASSITKIATGAGDWYEWDITTLAQEAFTNHSGRLTVAVTSNWSGTLWFSSAENQTSGFRPQLLMDYVDNPNGISPPPAAALISPGNLEVLYESNGMLLESPLRPTLSWQPITGATGYVLRLKEGSNNPVSHSSWIDSGFSANLTSWTPSSDLSVQALYTWDVQAISGSIPGPRSSSWSFAIGDPDTQTLGNHVHQSLFREGHDSDVLAYPQIHDATLDESEPTTSRGDASIRVGIGCGAGMSNNDECEGVLMVDLGQIPLSIDANAHSAELRLWLNSVPTADASYMDLSVHRLLNHNFDESGATWQNAAFGTTWSQSGMASGTDYESAPLDTVRVYASATSGWLSFDVSNGLPAAIDGTFGVALIGAPNNGRMIVDLAHSEDTTAAKRPELDFNYTTVNDIQISGSNSTDADTQISFTAQMFDAHGGALSGTVVWDSSGGSIDQSGVFTPELAGVVMISAGYGQVTRTMNVTVTPGIPTTLVTTPVTAALTTDEQVNLTGEVRDQHGNPVDGETITWSATNGSFSTTGGMSTTETTPMGSLSWLPYLSGSQTVSATWDTTTIDIQVVVVVGTPDHLLITGCLSVAAGENCTYTWTVHDWRGNEAMASLAGTVTWSVDNGNITPVGGLFEADHVGNWTIRADASVGVNGSFSVEVGHGTIREIRLVANSTSITADDEISLQTTRVDVRGNEMLVVLAMIGWTVSNGTVTTVDGNQTWTPWTKGQQWVEASLEGVSTRIHITVADGAPVSLEVRVRGGGDATAIAGESRTIDGYAVDQRGNQKPVALESWTLLENGADQSWLEDYRTNAIFNAREQGDWTIRGLYLWEGDDGTLSFHDDQMITVSAGSLASISFDATEWSVDADSAVTIAVTTVDAYGNPVPNSDLEWWIHDTTISNAPADCGVSEDSERIQKEIVDGVLSFDANQTGSYVICATQNGHQSRGTMTVSHGVAVTIWHDAVSDSIIAGGILDITLWAMDADGNEFRIATEGWDGIDWLTGSETGDYRYAGTVKGTYQLTYIHGSLSGVWNVTVEAADLNRIELSLDRTAVEQLETVTLRATGYDEFDNIVPLENTQILATGHEVTEGVEPQTWLVEVLKEGDSQIQVSSGGLTAQIQVTVTGNVAGFFQSGGPVAYAGAGVVALIAVGVIVFIIVLIRKGDDDGWDDWDEEEDVGDGLPSDTRSLSASADPPSGPEGPEGPATAPSGSPDITYDSEPEFASEDDDGVTVDEEGTEWWEDEDGAWWFRTPDMDDWEIYED